MGTKKTKTEIAEIDNTPPVEDMFDKFQKALRLDAKGTPRNAIIATLDISSATFYKWIKNPNYWADKYKTKPENLMRTTKEIVRSIRKKEASIDTVKGILKDLDLNEYELEFIYHYIEQRNTTEAMLRTLPPNLQVTRRTAKIRATKLLQRKSIREGIDRIMQWELEGIHISLKNDLVGQLYRMAFYDPAMFIDTDGKSRFKSIDDIPKEYRCCVKGIKPMFHPKDPKRSYYEVQLVDRFDAMKELNQYANLYEDNNTGLKSIGEGLKKVADILDKNKLETIDGVMEDVTPNPEGNM